MGRIGGRNKKESKRQRTRTVGRMGCPQLHDIRRGRSPNDAVKGMHALNR